MSRYDVEMPVTSHDVARLAGVSQPTVSRALRDQRAVSALTRVKVREAARALGYVPSQSGRTLSTRTTRRVAVVSAELGNPFYPALLEPLHDALAEHGFRTILITDRGDVPVEVEQLIDGSLDGAVLTTSGLDSTLPQELDRRGLPYVMLNRVVLGVAGDVCASDNHASGAIAADFLLELGHRRIAAVHGPDMTSTGRERAIAFHDRLAEHGISVPDRWVHRGPFAEATGRRAVAELMTADDAPTAVFCGNDVIAMGVCNGAHEVGIGVPSELTVIGIDDIPMAAWPVFDLTTLRTDLGVLALGAADLLVGRMRNPGLAPREVRLVPELVRRGTHAPPA